VIVSSLLVLVTAAILLVIGMVTGSNHLLLSSIAASLAAGVALYMGVRGRARRVPVPQPRQPDFPAELADAPTREIPAIGGRVFEPTDYAVDRGPVGGEVVDELRDEPTEQRLSRVEVAALMRLDAEVVVVDGRPRFHSAGCVHLVGRECEPLPVAEAIELGFTPCALCEPATRLLLAPHGAGLPA
jgi:hypothetical protein